MEGNVDLKNQPEVQSRNRDLRQRVEDKFKQVFGEVFQRDTPQISIGIFFSFHGTPEDLEGLHERIKEADIYIPEGMGWTKNHLDALRNASFGKISLDVFRQRYRGNPAFRRKLEDVYNSCIAITIIDVPSRHRLNKESDAIWVYDPYQKDNFSETLDYTRESLCNIATNIDKREEYMLSQITQKRIEELLGAYPSLRNQKPIKILLSIGSSHAASPSDYSESSFTDEGIIRSRLGEKIDDDLVAKIFLERYFELSSYSAHLSLREWLSKSSRKISRFERLIISQLNLQDAKRIFDYIKRTGIRVPRTEFERIFEEKDIKIPQSEGELDELLVNQRPKINDTQTDNTSETVI